MPAFEKVAASYPKLWAGMKLNTPAVIAAADQVARRILAAKAQYQVIESQTGVPWFFVGLTHYREGNLKFSTYLGNGQALNRVTTIEPKGRGPFPDFNAGARDALAKMKFSGKPAAWWTLARIAYSLEGFNGYGYRQYGVNSPYLWGGSNQYTRGKYVADHDYRANVVDAQLGTMPILARLCAMDPDVNLRVNGGQAGEVRNITKDVIVTTTAAGGGGLVAGVKAGWSVRDYAELALLVLLVALAAYLVLRLFRYITSKPAVEMATDHPAVMAAAPIPELPPARRAAPRRAAARRRKPAAAATKRKPPAAAKRQTKSR